MPAKWTKKAGDYWVHPAHGIVAKGEGAKWWHWPPALGHRRGPHDSWEEAKKAAEEGKGGHDE